MRSILRCVRPHGHSSVDHAGNITRAVAHERAAFARERGDHELAPFPIGHRLKGVRIDDLEEELVLGYVQAVCGGALHGDTRSHDLGQAVHVAVLHAELLTNLFAHALARRLGAQDNARNREILSGVVAHLDSRVGDEERIGRRAGKDVSLKVAHHLNLALGVAGAGRNNGAARRLATRVGA